MRRLLVRTLNIYKGPVSGGRPEGVRTGADTGDPGAGSAPTSSLPVAPETGQGRRGETGLDPGTWGMCALHRDEGQVPDQGVGRAPCDSVLRWHRQESGAAFQGHVLMGGVEKLGATRAFRQLLPEFSIRRDAEVQFEGTGQKDRLRASIAHSVLRKQDWPQRAGRWPASQQHPGLSKRCAVRPAAAPEASGGRLGGGCIFCGGYHKTPQPWWFKTMKKGQNVKRKKKSQLAIFSHELPVVSICLL